MKSNKTKVPQKEGWYIVENLGFSDLSCAKEVPIYRVIHVTVIPTGGGYFQGRWYSAGAYFTSVGTHDFRSVEAMAEWSGLKIVPLDLEALAKAG